jgi:hypothetical protein
LQQKILEKLECAFGVVGNILMNGFTGIYLDFKCGRYFFLNDFCC